MEVGKDQLKHYVVAEHWAGAVLAETIQRSNLARHYCRS